MFCEDVSGHKGEATLKHSSDTSPPLDLVLVEAQKVELSLDQEARQGVGVLYSLVTRTIWVFAISGVPV